MLFPDQISKKQNAKNTEMALNQSFTKPSLDQAINRVVEFNI